MIGFPTALVAASIHPLASLNAALNGVALVLLLAGYAAIKVRLEGAHKWLMLAAFGASICFLVSYLYYHFVVLAQQGSLGVKFGGQGPVRYLYFGILISHVILAAIVPFLAIATMALGWQDSRRRHVRLGRWTLPIWLYVSVTGVVIYWMLYHLYPPLATASIIGQMPPIA